MIDKGEALDFSLAHEEADALRPPAMPLEEREEKVVWLAQRGLRVRDVQLRILEFVGLAQGQQEVSMEDCRPTAGFQPRLRAVWAYVRTEAPCT